MASREILRSSVHSGHAVLTPVCSQVYTDDDISTKFHWQRPHMLSSESTATVTWKIPEGTEEGTYMIWNYGDYKHLTGGIVPFNGHSSEL